MVGRAGLLFRRVARALSPVTWAVAAIVAGAMLDMPLHARVPSGGGPLVPFDPEVQMPGPSAPRREKPQPAPKKENRGIEYAPWEHVPT